MRGRKECGEQFEDIGEEGGDGVSSLGKTFTGESLVKKGEDKDIKNGLGRLEYGLIILGGDGKVNPRVDMSSICFLMVAFLGPLSCCTASLFIPTSTHRLSLHPLHWLRCVLSITHCVCEDSLLLQG